MKEITTHMVLTPGMVLSGMYQIIRLIGQGGMGAVYMAYDMSLDLKVAVKVISSGVVENMEAAEYDLALKRFQAEARIVARIDHPNVIRIFGFKQDTIECDGKSTKIDYLVMELMAERTLRETMDDSGFEFETEIRSWITKYMIPILEGLEKVHENGIIHRDIKPENIFLKENNAKLADFGLSMGSDFPSVTGSMVEILGTFAYMAPEQYNNFSMARESADIFAVGRLLFEIVEGKINEKVIPFTQVELTDTNTAYNKALNHIIMEATAENPTERIGSIKELKERLIDIHQCPLNASPPRKGFQERRWLSQSLWILLIVAIFSLSFLAVEVFLNSKSALVPEPQMKVEVKQSNGHQVVSSAFPKGLEQTIRTDDDSMLRLVPPMEVKLDQENPFGVNQIKTEGFYLSENPITNEQYVEFLNSNLDKIEYIEDSIHLEERLILKLSEKLEAISQFSLMAKGSQCSILCIRHVLY